MEWATLLQPIRIRQASSVSKMSNDGRSPFKKDLDTVCNCTGIRRLQDKAQVFPLEREDYARTRLTHSIEVTSIAESLGVEAVSVIKTKGQLPKLTMDLVNEIPTILRVAAYLHDMGNPPFGHLGEEIIGDWFKQNLSKLKFSREGKLIFSDTSQAGDELVANYLTKQMKEDFLNFEGNAQLLRLVTRLSNVVDENGMNLTYPVLATIIKYPKRSTEINPKNGVSSKKMGYMFSEEDIYDTISSNLGLFGKRHPLVFLLEAADDIAYLTADMEDAHKKGLIRLTDIIHIFEDCPDDPFIADVLREYHKYEEQWLVTPIPSRENYLMQRLRIFIKGKMISAVKNSFNQYYQQIMDGEFESELLSVSDASALVSLIRHKIERGFIYYSPAITRTKIKSYQIINSLMSRFIPCVFNARNAGESDDKESLIYSLISNNYRYVCERKCEGKSYNDQDNIYYKLLLVTDYISGMTDTYAMDMYHLLTATQPI